MLTGLLNLYNEYFPKENTTVDVSNSPTETQLLRDTVHTATINAGETHTYSIFLHSDPVYYICWEDADNVNDTEYADILVGIRHTSDEFYHSHINPADNGNFGINRHRLLNLKSAEGTASAFRFIPNSWYIIEVKGYDTSSGTYKIVVN